VRRAVHAEWTKLRTVRAPPVLLGTIVLTVLLSALTAAARTVGHDAIRTPPSWADRIYLGSARRRAGGADDQRRVQLGMIRTT